MGTNFSKVLFLLIVCIISQGVIFSQNVGISSSQITPDASSMLEVRAANRGLLIPNVALTATNVVGPISAPATSLLVFNTATAGTGATSVTPGYYYNAGTPTAPDWQRFATHKNAWQLTGNLGTDPAINWLGTNDNQDLAVKTNNIERLRIYKNGDIFMSGLLGIGTTLPVCRLDVSSSATSTDNIVRFLTPALNIGAASYLKLGKAASIIGTDRGNAADIVFNYAGNNSDNNYLGFGFYDAPLFMMLKRNGNLGIGTNYSPTEKLDVEGNIKATGLSGAGNRPVFATSSGVLDDGRSVGYPISFSSNMRKSPDDVAGTNLSGDDAGMDYTLPFSFNIGGTTYTAIRICTNGWVTFGTNTQTNFGNDCLPTSSFSQPLIAAYWDDLKSINNEIDIQSEGTSPGRIVTIKWEAETYSLGYDVFFEVIIHEKGMISVSYHNDYAFSATGQSATIGFQMAGGSSAIAYPISCNAQVIDDNDERQGWSIFIPQDQ